MSSDIGARLAPLADKQKTKDGIQGFNKLVFGTRLHAGQLEVELNATKQTNLISPGNSWGKSSLIARQAARRAWFKLQYGKDWNRSNLSEWWKHDWRGLVASYQFDIAKEAYQRLRILYEQGGPLHGLISRITMADPPTIEFVNGSVLDFGSLDHGGRHVEATRRQYIAVDEVGHMPDFRQIYDDVLRPRTIGVSGQIWLYGTPKEWTDPWLFEIAQDARSPESVYYFREGSSFENEFWPPHEKELLLADPTLYNPDGTLTRKGQQVIEGKFLLVQGKFFQPVAVLRMFSGEHSWYAPTGPSVVTAWDLGGSKKGGDATVGVTLDCNTVPWRVTRLEHVPAGDMDWSERYELIERCYKEDGAHIIGVDVTGSSSDAVAEALMDRGLPIEPIHFGGHLGNKKYDMLRLLQSKLDETWEVVTEDDKNLSGKGMIRFPAERSHPALTPRRKEFDNYRLEDKGLTTDTVIALGMATRLANDYIVPPSLAGRVY